MEASSTWYEIRIYWRRNIIHLRLNNREHKCACHNSRLERLTFSKTLILKIRKLMHLIWIICFLLQMSKSRLNQFCMIQCFVCQICASIVCMQNWTWIFECFTLTEVHELNVSFYTIHYFDARYLQSWKMLKHGFMLFSNFQWFFVSSSQKYVVLCLSD